MTEKTRNNQVWHRFKLRLMLYLLCLPTIGSLLVFSYYPKADVVLMSFFRWIPGQVLEFNGTSNYQEAFADPLFWNSFKLVGVLLLANLVKLWPGILAAIALHRIASNKLRYFFQVCFVVPMVIPMMVWLLIWKSFYDPDFGLLNRVLNGSGAMDILQALDTAMPALSNALQPAFNGFFNPVFGGLGGLILLGVYIFALGNRKEHDQSRWADYGAIFSLALVVPVMSLLGLMSTASGLGITLLIAVGVMFWLSRRLGNSWIAWPFVVLAGVVVFWNELWRLPLTLVVAIGVFELVRAKRDFYTGKPVLMMIALSIITVGAALVLLGKVWTDPIGQFETGTPAWLGNPDLIVPSLIFWGFPWVGTVGVLIYLSGLQNIPQDVYEAAELDGVSPLGMIWHIELPLIMTQVRINLIFMTISTLTAYETFLILLGPDGGPDNRGMVPGLYMFRSAFTEGRFGYACSLGMVLFVIIILLTIVYQKYVRVDK